MLATPVPQHNSSGLYYLAQLSYNIYVEETYSYSSQSVDPTRFSIVPCFNNLF